MTKTKSKRRFRLRVPLIHKRRFTSAEARDAVQRMDLLHNMLADYNGEHGHNESAEETLSRLLYERKQALKVLGLAVLIGYRRGELVNHL